MPRSILESEQSVTIGADNEVKIPRRISKALRLKAGDHILLRIVGQRVEMVPAKLVPRDQLWFWAPEWQQMEREADEDIRQGRVKEHQSAKELLRELKS
ncbi:MAG: AbrB/MazE/SpoVT family DNA-binding domain-containing protein [Terriglobia bacterium]